MIVGTKTLIRAIGDDDLPKLVQWRNDKSIQQNLIGWHFPVSLEDEKLWLERVRGDRKNKRFAIEADSGEYIGNIGLYDIDFINRHCGFGIFIGDPRYRGGGYATDATTALIKFAIEELGMVRLCLTVLATNDKAIKLYERVGFKLEGVLRRQNFRGGEYVDENLMGLLKEELITT